MEINFGIIAAKPVEGEEAVDILHFCGYEEQPTDADYAALREELAADKEIGLVANINDLLLVEAPPEIVELYRQMYETDANWHEAN